MLRFRILVPVIPLMVAALLAPADYRIFAKSKTFTAREAASLIVSASSAHPHLASASL